MESLSAANTQFSLNVFKKIGEINTSGNVFFSPLSISSALAMVSLGAKENTQDQILQVLCLKKSEPVLLQMQIQDLPVCVKADLPMMPMMQEIKQSDLPVCVKYDPPMMQEIKIPELPVCVKEDPPMMHEIKQSELPDCVKAEPIYREIKRSDLPVCVKAESIMYEIKQSDLPVLVKEDQPMMHEIKRSDIPVCVKADRPMMHEIKRSDIPVCVKGDRPMMHEIKRSDIPICVKADRPMMHEIKRSDIPVCVKADRPMMHEIKQSELPVCVKAEPIYREIKRSDLPVCVKAESIMYEIKQSDLPVLVKEDPPMMHEIKRSDMPVCVKADRPMMHEIKRSDIPVCVKADPPMMHEIKRSDMPVCVKADRPIMHEIKRSDIPVCVKSQYEPPKLQTPMEPKHKQEDLIHSSYNKLMSELNKPGVPYMLSLANRLYGEKSYQFIDKFISDSQKYYKAGLESVDFIKNSEAARVNINNWVQKNTQGKIKDLLAQGILNNTTRLVLVNAIYFKGNWEKKFKKEATVDQQFKVNKNETKPVKMMKQTSKFPLTFIPEVNSQILELPYVGKNLSMLIILPNEIEDDTTGLQKLETTLTYEKLVEWTKRDKMIVEKVQISLPKFKLEETYDMKNLLAKLGMVDAFEMGKANFSGMSPKNDLVVSKVIHKSFVEVNEEGTEAAAATGVVMGLLSMPPNIFNADHPFLFFIRHNPTNTILFYGRFCSP